MAKVDLPYVNSFRDRHGKQRHYFRRGDVREALPGKPGGVAFTERYDELLASFVPHEPSPGRPPPRMPLRGTLAWVIDRFRQPDNREWAKLKDSTREVYDRLFAWLTDHYGNAMFATMRARHVRRIRNKLKDRPSVADHTVDKIGMLWRFAKEHLDMTELDEIPNPAAEVSSIHRAVKHHKAWPPELCRAFEGLDNPRLVRAYFLLRYTGQRRSDVVRMTRARYDGSAISLVQEKTGTYVWVPCHKRLRDQLKRGGIEGEFLLSTVYGGAFRATSLTNMICTACADLGFPGYSPHGLRHLAGAALAEAGCSMDEIMSILGHLTEEEARGYVQQARRKVMAVSAVEKWEASDARAKRTKF